MLPWTLSRICLRNFRSRETESFNEAGIAMEESVIIEWRRRMQWNQVSVRVLVKRRKKGRETEEKLKKREKWKGEEGELVFILFFGHGRIFWFEVTGDKCGEMPPKWNSLTRLLGACTRGWYFGSVSFRFFWKKSTFL